MGRHDAPGVLPLAQFTRTEDVLAGLRQRGGRATAARRLLLVALFRDRRHRSAEELAEEVRAQSQEVNLSTIYRNLDELVRLGVVDRSRLGDGPVAYHLASGSDGHLLCEQCSAVSDVPGELFRDIIQTLDPKMVGQVRVCLSEHRLLTGQGMVLPHPLSSQANAARWT